jgi:phage protein U
MFAQLGGQIFENAKGFNSFEQTGEAVIAEHAIYGGKPMLQKTGDGLEELSLSMRFHGGFCNPETELNTLRNARDKGEVLPLLWGNGKLAGKFMIKAISVTVEDALPDGTALSVVASVSLKEYAQDDDLEREQTRSKNDAKAVNKKPPVQGQKKPYSGCPDQASANYRKIHSYSTVLNNEVAAFVPTTFVRQKIRYSARMVEVYNSKLLAMANDPSSCVGRVPQIKARCIRIKSDLDGLIPITDQPATNYIQLQEFNSLLQNDVRQLQVELAPILKQSINRR